MRGGPLWPKCAKCGGRVELRPRGDRVFAICCGREIEVRLAFVPIDAPPVIIGDENTSKPVGKGSAR